MLLRAAACDPGSRAVTRRGGRRIAAARFSGPLIRGDRGHDVDGVLEHRRRHLFSAGTVPIPTNRGSILLAKPARGQLPAQWRRGSRPSRSVLDPAVAPTSQRRSLTPSIAGARPAVFPVFGQRPRALRRGAKLPSAATRHRIFKRKRKVSAGVRTTKRGSERLRVSQTIQSNNGPKPAARQHASGTNVRVEDSIR